MENERGRRIRRIVVAALPVATIVLFGGKGRAEEGIVCATMLLNLSLIGTVRMKRRTRIVNALVFCGYNTVLLADLFFHGNGGTSFTWLFYLFLLNGAHAAALAACAAIRKIRPDRRRARR